MTRETYRDALAGLRADVVAMGELVVERLEAALECLETGDETLAREVVAGDEEVNQTYLALEDRCVDLLALQQPVAGDLRFVAASFKILTDLERVGDLAVNLAQYALSGTPARAPAVSVDDIGRDAVDLLARSLDAFEREDADACRAIAAADDDVDALCQRASEALTRDLVAHEAGGGDPWEVERLLDDVSRLLLTIRDVERVADHAVNIAARTLYMVENDPSLVY